MAKTVSKKATAPSAAKAQPKVKPAANSSAPESKQSQPSPQSSRAGYEDLAQLSKSNLEAVVRASQIWAKSAEDLSKALASFTQTSVEMGNKAGQAMIAVKTMQDLMEVQSGYARNSYDHFVTGASKFSDVAVKVAGEAFAPIQQSITATVEKFSKVA